MAIPPEFASALDDCREPDWVLLGIIADWMEDHGDEDAEGLRWAVKFRRWPYEIAKTNRWRFWVSSGSCWSNIPFELWSTLQKEIFRTQPKPYPISAAFLDLSRMIRLARADGYDAWKWNPNTKEMT